MRVSWAIAPLERWAANRLVMEEIHESSIIRSKSTGLRPVFVAGVVPVVRVFGRWPARFTNTRKGAIWSCKMTKRCYIDPLKLFIGKVISLEKSWQDTCL